MKNSFVLTVVLSVFSLTALSQTAPQLTELNGHAVIYQGQEVVYVTSHELYKTRVVTQLDAKTYEVLDAYFKCTARCVLKKSISRAFYSNCSQKRDQFVCRGKIRLGGENEVRSTNSTDMRTWDEEEANRENTPYWDGDESRREGNWETGDIVIF